MSSAIFDRSAVGIVYCPPGRRGQIVRRTAPATIKVDPAWGEGPSAAWYVLGTNPGRGYKVRDRLVHEGWLVWLPECVIMRHHKRYPQAVSRLKGPLFPGYLFIRLDMTIAAWRILEDDDHRDLGIERLLRIDDWQPQAVADIEVDRLRQLVENDGGALIIHAGQLRRQFITDEPLRVIEGPFTGHTVSFRSVDARGRINILLDIMGRATLIALEEAQVEPA